MSTSYIIDHPPLEKLNAGIVDEQSLPKVSFCIPTYNEGDIIKECLESIVSQDYENIEIIIVDGHSDDNTLSIVNEFTDNIYYDEGMLGSARQTSFENSNGEIIALFDADIILPDRGWLKRAVKRFNYSERVSTVWPRCIYPPNSPPTAKLLSDHSTYIVEDRINNKRGYFGGGNALFKRECLESIGGINPNLHWGEDFDWARRLSEEKYQVVYLRDPIYHSTANSWGEFTSKQFTGAKTFAVEGFGLMGLSFTDVLYEQYILGFKGMVSGILNLKWWWLFFPIYISIKTIAYGYTYISSRL